MKAAFNEDELRVIGKHTQFGIYGGEDTEAVSYNYPITPKENMLRMLRGEKPLWVPNQTLENNALQPLVMDDARARNFGGKDWFGIEWEYEPLTRAAMVKPGTRRLDDITNWRSLEFPNLRAIDWKKDYKERYEGKISQDRLTYFIIVNGFFERTADLTSFEDAFCYLLEEPEALTEFYDRLAEWHIELIKIAKEYYHTDMILFHDDMGTQISTFFSPQIYKELFLPQYKKAIMDQYGKDLAQCTLFVIPADMSDEEAVAEVHKRVDELGVSGRFACRLKDEKPDRKVDLAQELYRYSRIRLAETK